MHLFIPLFLLLIYCADLPAAHFRDHAWQAERGIVETMSIEPRLPARGEGFTVRLQGSWPEKHPNGFCWAPLAIDAVTVHPGNRVQVISNMLENTSDCDKPPAAWDLEVVIPANAWEAVDEEGYLLFEHLLYSGINMLTGMIQVFDLRLGTHEVPAFLGSGFWVSPERPFEGVMVEQQGSRVLFYGLTYDRDLSAGDQGEPVWQMVSGDMVGNSVLGRSYRYDWPVDDGLLPDEIPEHDDVHTVNDSGAIIVDDYNHIRVFTRVEDEIYAWYDDYQRLVFGMDPARIPVYVPPLDGRWVLQGFEDQDLVVTVSLELRQASSPGPHTYRYDSVLGDSFVECNVVSPGTGQCHFEHSADGLEFEFPISAFQGNLARGNLKRKDGTGLTGILVRKPWQLPAAERVP